MNLKIKPIILLILAVLPPALGSCHPAEIPTVQAPAKWIHLEPGDRISAEGFVLFLKKGDGRASGLYLKGSSPEPYRFLTGEIRSFADVMVSPGRRYLLINGPCSSRSRCVFSADIQSGRTLMISGGVNRSYKEHTAPDVRSYPVGDSFSPDESLVLIQINFEPSEDRSVAEEFKRWYYVVDAVDGTIRNEFRAERLPDRWWERVDTESPQERGFY